MMESFEIQALRNMVKKNGPDVVANFEKKFKEIKVEGKRKSHASIMYTEQLLSTYYTEAEHKEIEALYTGTESESRKRFQRNRSFSQQRGQSQDRRQISFSRNRYDDPRAGFNQEPRLRYDRFKSSGRQEDPVHHDQL